MENNYILIAIITIIGLISHGLAFISGMDYGSKLEQKSTLKALSKTFDTWMEAQREAGLTDEQMEIISKSLAKKSRKLLEKVIENNIRKNIKKLSELE